MLRFPLSRPALSRTVLAALLAGIVVPLAATPALADDGTADPTSEVTPAPAAAPTTLRISAPDSVPTGSSADVSVRLLAGDEAVPDQTVLIQRQAPSGWVEVASVTTREDGLGHGAVPIGSTERFRAFYRGDAAHESSTSPEIVIAAGNGLGAKAVAEARRHHGAPYGWGAAGPSRFDCSGLTMYVFARLGRQLPHNAAAQADATHRIANSAKQPGDLIFTFHGGTIGHVGIYAGGSQMWAAVKTGDVVRLQSFAGRAYRVGRVS